METFTSIKLVSWYQNHQELKIWMTFVASDHATLVSEGLLDGMFQLDIFYPTESWFLIVYQNFQQCPSFLIEAALLDHGHRILSLIDNWVSFFFLFFLALVPFDYTCHVNGAKTVTTTLLVAEWLKDWLKRERERDSDERSESCAVFLHLN